MLQAPKRRKRRDGELPYSQRTPYRRNQPGTRAKPACSLTGVEIQPGDRIKVRHVPSHRTKPGYLQADGNLLVAPLTLHRSTPDGRLGLAYSVMMARYLDLAVSEQRAEVSQAERLALVAWWESEYGVSRVRRGLRERLSDADADAILTAVIACHREQADPDEIGPRYGHDGAWLREQVQRTFRLANRRGRASIDDAMELLS